MAGGSLTFDAAGNLYGTTVFGGNSYPSCYYGNVPSCGVVFMLTHSNGGWAESVIYAFTGVPVDGANPYGGVVLDTAGNVYGTTYGGGVGLCLRGCGEVYEVSPSGSGWSERPFYVFCLIECAATNPTNIALDSRGNLYTAPLEAAYEFGPGGFGLIDPNLCCEVIGNFITDAAGNLYGTSQFGGLYGWGTVFKLTPSSPYWTYTSLHDFTNGSDGGQPLGFLVFDSNGNLYGTATVGGTGEACAGGCGVMFKIKP